MSIIEIVYLMLLGFIATGIVLFVGTIVAFIITYKRRDRDEG